jgi:hypothetical protein
LNPQQLDPQSRALPLSYAHRLFATRAYFMHCPFSECLCLARLEGFEPTTYGLEIRCSIQLSYRRSSAVAVNGSAGCPLSDIGSRNYTG